VGKHEGVRAFVPGAAWADTMYVRVDYQHMGIFEMADEGVHVEAKATTGEIGALAGAGESEHGNHVEHIVYDVRS
jgi:hypothetical protein